MIPIAAIAGVFTIISTFPSYEPTMQQEILASAGSYAVLLVSSASQTVLITVICGFLGYIFADKIGLLTSYCLSLLFTEWRVGRCLWPIVL